VPSFAIPFTMRRITSGLIVNILVVLRILLEYPHPKIYPE
jgi:hypothetical protein